jgi:hypothetical protein
VGVVVERENTGTPEFKLGSGGSGGGGHGAQLYIGGGREHTPASSGNTRYTHVQGNDGGDGHQLVLEAVVVQQCRIGSGSTSTPKWKRRCRGRDTSAISGVIAIRRRWWRWIWEHTMARLLEQVGQERSGAGGKAAIGRWQPLENTGGGGGGGSLGAIMLAVQAALAS